MQLTVLTVLTVLAVPMTAVLTIPLAAVLTMRAATAPFAAAACNGVDPELLRSSAGAPMRKSHARGRQ